MSPMNALFHQTTTQPDGIGLDRFCLQIVDKGYESRRSEPARMTNSSTSTPKKWLPP
jgi:hypothetical protein